MKDFRGQIEQVFKDVKWLKRQIAAICNIFKLTRVYTSEAVVSLDAWTYTIWETAIPSIEITFNAYDDVTYVGEYWVRFEIPSGGITFTAPSTVVFPPDFTEFEEGKIYELGFVDGNVTLNYWNA